MVSLTNGVLSRGNGDQRALENGYHSSSIGGCRPKYKPRMVSAIRDFPPGCGLNAPRIDRQSEENVVVSGENQRVDATGSNCVGALGIMVDYQSGEVEGKRAGEDMNASLYDLVEKMVAAATVEIEGFSTQVEPIGSEWSNDLENVALQLPEELHGKDDQVLVEESPEDGSKSLVAEENKILLEIGAVVGQSKTLLGVGTVGNRANSEVIPKSLFPPQWPIGDSGVVEDRTTIPKNKYRRRRVSANRDFPPFCGNNAPRPTEENQLRIPGSKSLCGLENSATHDIPPVCGNKEPRPAEEGRMRISESESLHGVENLATRGFPPFYWNNAPKPTEEDHVKISRGTSLCGEKDSAILVCPPCCGSNAPRPTEDYRLKISRNVENSAARESPPFSRNSVPRPTEENRLRISGRKSSYGVENSATCDFPPVCGNKSPRPTDEDQLRISGSKSLATRDFPPFCGKNALKPTEEDRLKISSRKSMSVVKKVIERTEALEETIMDGGTLGETSRDSLEDMTQRDVVQGDTVESGGGITDPNFEMIQLKETLHESRKSLAVIKQESKHVTTSVQTVRELSTAVAKSIGCIQDDDSEKTQSEEIVAELVKPLTAITMDNEDVTSFVGMLGKDLVVYSQEKSLKRKTSGYIAGLGDVEERVIVQGLMAAPFYPWRHGRCSASSSVGDKSKSKIRRPDLTRQHKSKLVIKTDNCVVDYLKGKSKQERPVSAEKATHESSGAIVVRDAESQLNIEQQEDFPAHEAQNDFDVSLPPFGPNSSSHGDARNRVRETLRLFQAICRKLLQGQEAKMIDGEELKSKQEDDKRKRIDLIAAKIIKKKRNCFSTGRNMVGAVPGVVVGDEFQFRVELAIVGIHRPYQGGIDYLKHNGELIAISIVASGGYADDLDNADVLIYSGQGGSAKGKDKQPEHQKLERGNLALKNSVLVKNPVRVIRGSKEKVSESLYAKGKVATSYVYDGLYTVEKYWMDTGPHGKLVFMFELKRIPGQPELAWAELKKSKKYKIREGVLVDDISGGKESFPICAVNTIDDEKLAPFIYTTRMIYPEWYCPEPPNGCDCNGRCSYSRKCLCALKNGGEIPYNYNGAIVEAKPLIYECGPCCKCPPSCYNRVSQHGIKIQLEIFKTESRGWGVRSLSFITSGTFICEYTGELLEDKEAEQRVGNDEYLFDIGQNYNDCSHKPDTQSDLSAFIEEGSFTIDAAQYGNVGRFINHSCSPNLYAQNVLYDHEDKRMPHIMLFAAENIPPLQELTYHYNYSMDEVHDLNGNIKMKSCYCGSAECTGRMY